MLYYTTVGYAMLYYSTHISSTPDSDRPVRPPAAERDLEHGPQGLSMLTMWSH